MSNYYLSYIENIMVKTKQSEFHILGWSLGGHIALKIAELLEKRNFDHINIYLLDTVLPDSFLTDKYSKVKIDVLVLVVL